jgi:hypothetical protein
MASLCRSCRLRSTARCTVNVLASMTRTANPCFRGGVSNCQRMEASPMSNTEKIIRLKTVLARTGLSRSTMYRKIAEGITAVRQCTDSEVWRVHGPTSSSSSLGNPRCGSESIMKTGSRCNSRIPKPTRCVVLTTPLNISPPGVACCKTGRISSVVRRW